MTTSSIAPAPRRAGVQDTFQAFRADTQSADRAARLAGALGITSQHLQIRQQDANRQELEAAQRERDEGFAAALIADGERIRRGEIEGTDSDYFMAGVRLGTARRRGLEAGNRLTQARIESPPPIDDPDAYIEWLDGHVAAISEEDGFEDMGHEARRVYAQAINEVRQNDMALQRSAAQSFFQQEAYENVGAEVHHALNGSGGDLSAAMGSLEAVASAAYARGLSGAQVKTRIYQEVHSRAIREENPELIREIASNDALMNSALRVQAERDINTLERVQEARRVEEARQMEEARKERERSFLTGVLVRASQDPYYAPTPEEIAEIASLGGPELVTRTLSSFQAMRTASENGVNPARMAYAERSLRNAAMVNPQAAAEMLQEAVTAGDIPAAAYQRMLDAIDTGERAAPYFTNETVQLARRQLDVPESQLQRIVDPTAVAQVQLLRHEHFNARMLAWIGDNTFAEASDGSLMVRAIPQHELSQAASAIAREIIRDTPIDSFTPMSPAIAEHRLSGGEAGGESGAAQSGGTVTTPSGHAIRVGGPAGRPLMALPVDEDREEHDPNPIPPVIRNIGSAIGSNIRNVTPWPGGSDE